MEDPVGLAWLEWFQYQALDLADMAALGIDLASSRSPSTLPQLKTKQESSPNLWSKHLGLKLPNQWIWAISPEHRIEHLGYELSSGP